MSAAKHTPGPWMVSCNYVMARTGDGAHAICTIDHYRVPKGEPDANARLIAASPKLLAALKVAVQYADSHPEAYIDKNGFAARWISEARAAIAEAEGR